MEEESTTNSSAADRKDEEESLVVCRDEGRLRISYLTFYTPDEADELKDALLVETEFKTVKGRFGSKSFTFPRKIAAYGDAYTTYEFSGACVRASPWTPLSKRIKRRVEAFTKCSFNFVLLNLYRDGKDEIGAHKDDETSMSKYAPIASLSFGASRKMVFRKGKFKEKVFELELKHGSLCVMWYPTNRHYYHEIGKQLDVLKPRLNLTFRKLNPACNYRL